MVVVCSSRAGEVDDGEQIRRFSAAWEAGVAGFEGGGGLGSSPADVAQRCRTRPCEAGSSCGLQSEFAMVRLLSGQWWSSVSSSGGSCGGGERWWQASVCSSTQDSRDLFVFSAFFWVLSAGALGQLFLRPLSSSLYPRMYGAKVVVCLY